MPGSLPTNTSSTKDAPTISVEYQSTSDPVLLAAFDTKTGTPLISVTAFNKKAFSKYYERTAFMVINPNMNYFLGGKYWEFKTMCSPSEHRNSHNWSSEPAIARKPKNDDELGAVLYVNYVIKNCQKLAMSGE